MTQNDDAQSGVNGPPAIHLVLNVLGIIPLKTDGNLISKIEQTLPLIKVIIGDQRSNGIEIELKENGQTRRYLIRSDILAAECVNMTDNEGLWYLRDLVLKNYKFVPENRGE